MKFRGKRYQVAIKDVSTKPEYTLEQSLVKVVENSKVKFDETVDIAIKLGVNPKHADQMVRGSLVLPNGLGKKIRVLVFAKGEKATEAEKAGAEYVGAEDLIEKIQGGWLEFETAIATPDMMAKVGKLGKILGTRGLMPNPKVGTVTLDVTQAVADSKAGKVEFRVEKEGIVHAPVGRVSFGAQKLYENTRALVELVQKLKPQTSKGVYMKSVSLSSTMGVAIKVDLNDIRSLFKK
jgi:large subunit ribosomal protein L1